MNYTFNGKNIRIPDDTIEKMVNLLDITREEAIQTWLEDEGFLENPEQTALCQKARESGIMRTIHDAKAITPVKTQRERVIKENPTKEKIIAEIAKFLRCDAHTIMARLEKMRDTNALLEKEIEAANVRLAQAELAGILATKRVSDSGMAVYAARIDVRERKDLLTYADLLRDKMDTGVALLGTILDAKPALICVVTQDAVARGLHAGKLVGACAAIVGGKGGGRPNTAQAGGTDTAKLDDAIAHIHTLV